MAALELLEDAVATPPLVANATLTRLIPVTVMSTGTDLLKPPAAAEKSSV